MFYYEMDYRSHRTTNVRGNQNEYKTKLESLQTG